MSQRYSRVATIVQLSLLLHQTTEGLTLEQISERFEVSRRTAERMLGAVREAFPDIKSERGEGAQKHWRVPRTSRAQLLVRVHAEEIAALDSALELLRRDGRPDQIQALEALFTKVRSMIIPERAPSIETDAEALLESEGLAMRPGPRPQIDLAVVSTLREALLACREVHLRYRSRIRKRTSERDVQPYGFLLGGRHYLVGFDLETREIRVFSLSNIEAVALTDRVYTRPENFDLKRWTARSFGVFQEKPRNVVWRFTPAIADLAREYRFHPSQTLEEQSDGSLIVRFRAGGLWEMAWHLFQWGDGVEILEPAELRDELVRMLRASCSVHDPA
ncbi:MAG: helix-turn-helix transcriptional regulator [Myxococcota bacterium]